MKVFLLLLSVCALSTAFSFSTKLASLRSNTAPKSHLQDRQFYYCAANNVTYVKPDTSCTPGAIDGTVSDVALCQINTHCVTSQGGSSYSCKFITNTTGCKTDSDCGYYDNSGLICLSTGKCGPPGMPAAFCGSSHDCLSGQCVKGACATKYYGLRCTGADCAKGLFCLPEAFGDAYGVCTTQFTKGRLCGDAFNTLQLPVANEYLAACAPGFICNLTISNPDGSSNARCVAAFSQEVGAVVGLTGDYLCDPSTFLETTDSPTVFTCSSNNLTCSYPSDCQSLSQSVCDCENYLGQCKHTNTSCAPTYVDAYNCLIGNQWGLNGFSQIYNTNSTLYTACNDVYQQAICCEYHSDPDNTYDPYSLCNPDNGSVVLSICFALYFIVAALL